MKIGKVGKLTLPLFAVVTMGLLFSGAVANAAICASCHSDGRTGTPPATPTHIRLGLVPAAGGTGTAAAKPAAKPAATAAAPAATTAPAATAAAPAPATATAATPAAPAKPAAAAPAPAKSPAGTARTRTAAAGNGTVCAKCHSDGRSGVTPPGHRALSGMYGNGNAPPPKPTKSAGGTVTGGAAKGTVAKGAVAATAPKAKVGKVGHKGGEMEIEGNERAAIRGED